MTKREIGTAGLAVKVVRRLAGCRGRESESACASHCLDWGFEDELGLGVSNGIWQLTVDRC